MAQPQNYTTILIDRRPTNIRINEKGKEAYFTDLILCVERGLGLILGFDLLNPKEGDAALIAVAQKTLSNLQQSAPGADVVWVVRQDSIKAALASSFSEESILPRTGADFAPWDEAYIEMDANMGGGGTMLPFLWRGDITEAEVANFYEAAARYYRARPWRFFASDELLEIQAPDSCPGPQPLLVSVLGADKIARGLVIYNSYKDFDELMSGKSKPSGLFASLDPIKEVPPIMVMEAEQYGWTVVNKSAFPTAMHVKKGRPIPCCGNDLRRLTVALQMVDKATKAPRTAPQ